MKLLDNLKKIRELLSDESRWTRLVYARDANGARVNEHSPLACSWCLLGAVSAVCYHAYTHNDNDCMTVLFHLERMLDKKSIAVYNDSDTTKHSDILDLIDRTMADFSEPETV